MIAVMGVASLTPAFPKMAETLNLSKVEIGLLISAFTFPGVILTPFMGVLADRIGRKKVLIPSLFLFALAGSAIFFIHNFHIIVILRVLQGIGGASLGSLNTTLIGDFFKGKDRPTAMGLNAGMLSTSTGIYPLIGGGLATIAWYYPFLLPLLAIPVGIFVIFKLPEPEIEKVSDIKQYFKAISSNIMKKEVIGIFILGVLTFIILYGAFITYMPFLLHQHFKLPSARIGLVFSLSSFMSVIVSTQIGKLTNHFGSLKMLKAAFVIYTLVCVLVPNVYSFLPLILLILCFGMAQALNIPSLQTILANIAPDDQRAAFMSLNGMILRLGQTLGPVVIGLGYSLYNVQGAYYFAGAVAIIGLVVTFTMIKEDKIKPKY